MAQCIPPPSAIAKGNDLALFRDSVAPTWEDPRNIGGGRWSTVIKIAKHTHHHQQPGADDVWLETLLAVVGEQLYNRGDSVVGCVLNVRDGYDRVSVWIDHTACKSLSVVMRIGAAWKNVLARLTADPDIGDG
jgi:hypothetical protein